MAASGSGRSSDSDKYGRVPIPPKRGGKVPTGSVGSVTPPKGGSKPASPSSSNDK